jgi:hypothetical protein
MQICRRARSGARLRQTAFKAQCVVLRENGRERNKARAVARETRPDNDLDRGAGGAWHARRRCIWAGRGLVPSLVQSAVRGRGLYVLAGCCCRRIGKVEWMEW